MTRFQITLHGKTTNTVIEGTSTEESEESPLTEIAGAILGKLLREHGHRVRPQRVDFSIERRPA